jgi:AcrR family transcriptional regulator
VTAEHDDQDRKAPNNQPASGIPARRYSWEPFQPGHTLTLKHGAYSDRLVEPRALEIAHAMADAEELPDYLAQPRYRGAVLDLARSLAQRERLEAWLAEHATPGTPLELAENGDVRGAAVLLERVERAIERHRDRLGLSPLAAARLGKDVAAQQVSLSQVWAQMDAQESDGDGS